MKRLVLGLLMAGIGAGAVAQEIEVDAAMVDTRQGKVITSTKGKDTLQRLLVLQKWLVAQLLHGAGIDGTLLSPESRKRLLTPGFTRLEQLEAFGEALESMDRGDFPQARRILQQIDVPEMTLVNELLERLPETSVEGVPASEVTRTVAGTSANLARQLAAAVSSGETRELLAEAMTAAPLQAATPPPAIPTESMAQAQLGTIGADQAQTDVFYGENSDIADYANTTVPEFPLLCPAGNCRRGLYATFVAWRPVGSDDSFRESPYPYISGTDPANNTLAPGHVLKVWQLPKTAEAEATPVGSLSYQVNEDGSLTIVDGSEAATGESGFVGVHHTRGETGRGRFYSLVYYAASTVRGEDHEYHYFYQWLWGVEGTSTSSAVIADLAQQNAVYAYSGTAGADFTYWSGGERQQEFCERCGTFSARLDYGRMELENLQVNVELGAGRPALSIDAEAAPVDRNGSFGFAGHGRIGLSGDLRPADSVNVRGQVFGPQAEEIGGVFTIRRGEAPSDGSFFGAGNFGGAR